MFVIAEVGMLMIFSGCLGWAAAMDRSFQLVRRYIWWIAGGIGICMAVCRQFGEIYPPPAVGTVFWILSWPMESFNASRSIIPLWGPETGILLDVISYWMLQQFAFAKLYGRADAHAFTCCSFVFAALGMGMLVYLIHMLIAFVFLGCVQLFRKNINGRGNLKEPVAFIPYITVSFLVCTAGCIYGFL